MPTAIYTCLQCNKPTNNLKFCSRSCQATHNNKIRKPKIKTEIIDTKPTQSNIKQPITKQCPVCGLQHSHFISKWCDIKYNRFKTTKKLAECFNIPLMEPNTVILLDYAFNELKTKYYSGISSCEIHEQYKLSFPVNRTIVWLKSLGIKSRTLSEAVSNSYKTGRSKPPIITEMLDFRDRSSNHLR